MNRRRGRIIAYFIFFSLILVFGVVYAILQANLQINGTAKISENQWDVHFDNIIVNPDSVSIGTGDTAATIDPNNSCKIDFSVTLSLPGDFYEFTVDVVNSGTIDAMIGILEKTLKVNNVTLEEVPDYLIYTVTYDDDTEIQENQMLAKNAFDTYKVRIEFKTDIDEADLPDDTTLSMSVEPVYVQADSGVVNRPIAMFIDGKSFRSRIGNLGNAFKITAIRKSNVAPDMNSMTSDNMVSISEEKPIYVWFDNLTMYYYSDFDKIYLNTDASFMFNNLNSVSFIELDGIDTSKTTNMSYMFYKTGNDSATFDLRNISNWDTSRVTNMTNMFREAGMDHGVPSFSIDLSNWNTSNVERMYGMFYDAGANATVFDLGDLSHWDTSKVTNMAHLFRESGYASTAWHIGDLTNWNVSNVTNMSSMFANSGYYATMWSIGDLSNWDTSKVTNMSGMFNSAGYNATTWDSIGTLKIYASESINGMFYGCRHAKATLNLYTNSSNYSNALSGAAVSEDGFITINYTNDVTDIDNIIATKSSNSNVFKGNLFTP